MSLPPDDRLRDAYDDLGEAFKRLHHQESMIRDAYRETPREMLRQALLVEYRCPNKKGCLLLHAWRGSDPSPTFFLIPKYKMSRERNARESVESARHKNTLDGDRVWRPRAGILDDMQGLGDSIGLGVQCDHLDPRTITPAEILADAQRATRGRPMTRIITARYA